MKRYLFNVPLDIPKPGKQKDTFRKYLRAAAHNVLRGMKFGRPWLGFIWHTRYPETDPIKAWKEIRSALWLSGVILMTPYPDECHFVELEEGDEPFCEISLRSRTSSASAVGPHQTSRIVKSAPRPRLIHATGR